MVMPIFLMGPTAIGKTKLAMELSKEYPVDIISVDSSMVYKGMDIGSGKPTQTELLEYPHELVNIREIDQTYSAADFVQDATLCINQSLKNNRIPLLVGGSMMYFKALKDGLSPLPSSDPLIRAQLNQKWQENPAALVEQLQECDPVIAAKYAPGDQQRILRALEVYTQTGIPLSEWHKIPGKGYVQKGIWISLVPSSRETLRKKIAQRFHQMLKDGFVQEVEMLSLQKNFNPHLTALRAVGYKQVLELLRGELSAEQATQKAITATCQLAKRQLTWLRSWSDCHVCEWDETKTVQDIKCFLSNLNVPL